MNESHPEVAEYCIASRRSLELVGTTTLTGPTKKVTWEFFVAEFKNKYISEQYLEERWKKFLYLKQGNKPIGQYLWIEDFHELVNRVIATDAKMKAPENKKGDSHRSEKRTRSDNKSQWQSKRQRHQRDGPSNYSGAQKSNFVPRPQASSKTLALGPSTFSTGMLEYAQRAIMR
ncbi:hypothetical protein V6N12_050644 [Hibiscus sabdariffa]|uniref:Retrotransposon gag domain-containing protein n=1 Tax=Hibiscus sabdariffa TaxID=183260 RepID=A0ABR2GE66_9ROSI